MAAHENISSEQMREHLSDIAQGTGTTFTPGHIHLVTGHTVPARSIEMKLTDKGGLSGVTADVPLRMVEGNAKFMTDSSYDSYLAPAIWGRYRTEIGTGATTRKLSKEKGQHVENVLHDVQREGTGLKEVSERLESSGVDPTKLLSDYQYDDGPDWLKKSNAHISVSTNSDLFGSVTNPRYYNMWTGEFDDHILN